MLYVNLTKELLSRGVEQTIISPRGFQKIQVQSPHVAYYGQAIWGFSDKLLYRRKIEKYSQFLSKIDGIDSHNIIHAHSLYSDGVNALNLSKKYNIPYVVTIRHTDLYIFAKYHIHLRKSAREVLSNARHVIFLNNNYPAQLADRLKIPLSLLNFRVIPNGIDEFWLEEHPVRLTEPRTAIDVLSVANVKSEKNHRTLIKAVNGHNESSEPSIRLLIAGKAESSFAKRLKKRYESESIVFLGPLSQSEIMELHHQSDVFALLSRPENFGIAYAEAVSQGLPVIYSASEGFDGWRSEGFWGHSCEPYDEQAIIDRILLLWKKGRLNDNEIQDLKSCFNWSAIVDQLVAVYEDQNVTS